VLGCPKDVALFEILDIKSSGTMARTENKATLL
jgi:hypothetical protein